MAIIYCVEDDDSIREMILCALKTGGYEGTGFEKSKLMYNALEDCVPDLIFLDIMLPDEDGISTLKKLKHNNEYIDIPVILITAKGNESDKVMGLDAGAEDYIVKPFGILEFLSRIRTALRRTMPNKSMDILTVGELRIDTGRRAVSYNNMPVTLTHKEFELLHLLASNKELVISRDRLLSEVWGYDFVGESRTLDVHIRTLRHKLSCAGCGDYIKTVRNVGYKLEVPE